LIKAYKAYNIKGCVFVGGVLLWSKNICLLLKSRN